MGKAPKRLHLLVDESMRQWPEVMKLEEQGHQITSLQLAADVDMVLGPRCWRMYPELRKHLTLAIRAGRLEKYGEPKK